MSFINYISVHLEDEELLENTSWFHSDSLAFFILKWNYCITVELHQNMPHVDESKKPQKL